MTALIVGLTAWCVGSGILAVVLGRAIRRADARRLADTLSGPESFATGDTGPTGRPAATDSTQAATEGARGAVAQGSTPGKGQR